MLQDQDILVTGGAGFIGSHLTAALIERGCRVRVLDNLSSGRRANLAGLPATFIEGDVADFHTVRQAVEGCTLVFHEAAYVSAPKSVLEPELNHQTNVDGAFNVFEAARQAGVRRVVYASSAAVYGNRPGLPKRESDPPEPITPYAAAKLINEIYAQGYAAAYGLESVGLRYMNVFGPRQDPSSPYSGVISIFCRLTREGDAYLIYGDGHQTRDFIYVADVVQANLLAAAVPFDHCPTPAVFNVGRGQQTSINDIARHLNELGGRSLPLIHRQERAGDIKHSVADIGRAQSVLGFQPGVTVADGLRETWAWFEREA